MIELVIINILYHHTYNIFPVPEAPDGIKAVSSGPHTGVVSWRGPQGPPRGRLTRYTVHWSPQGPTRAPSSAYSKRVGPHVTHVTLGDLTTGTSYKVRGCFIK